MKSMPFHVQTGGTLVHGENLIGCVPSPLMGEGEKSVVSYQTYGSNDTRSMISESVR